MAEQPSELLPCPFCGCAAGYVKHTAGVQGTQGFDKWDAVACKHCRATIGACDRRFRCRDDAREAWNRRAALSPQPQQAGWMPISEAPKDGTEFLAIWGRQNNVMQVVQWNHIHKFWQSKGEPLLGFLSNATGWHPLPPVPGQEGEQP